MRRIVRLLFCGWFFGLAALSAVAEPLQTGVPTSFLFADKGYFSDKPFRVHYYKAASAGVDAKVLFSIHGFERNGARARDNWMEFAEKNRLIVLAPEFDAKQFPRPLFQLGGMEEKDSAKWTFLLIEKIFSQLQVEEALSTDDYMLFGHSAGAQFVHRFVLMMDRPRVSVAVAANAGTYTLPLYRDSLFEPVFPWALDEQRTTRKGLTAALKRDLVLLLGENDNDPDASSLSQTRDAMAQGATRLARGRNFFALAQAQSVTLGADFGWRLMTVPDTGHDSRAMARAAAKILFDDLRLQAKETRNQP